MEIPLLKQAVIYGANGSGKSNFIKAISFLNKFVTNDNFLNGIDLDDYIFQLAQEKEEKISFEIEFFHNGQYYFYAVGIDKKEISEKLSVSGLNKTDDKLIFERQDININSPDLMNEDSVIHLLMLNPKSSLLSLNLRFPVLTGDEAKSIYNWFSKQLEVIGINSQRPVPLDIFSQQPLLTLANEVFENIDIGINSLHIGNTPFDKWIGNKKYGAEVQDILAQSGGAYMNGQKVFKIITQKGIKTVQELLFNQLGQAGYHKEMNILAQSDGTVRLLTLIPALYGAMFQNKTIFIDEIDNSIHPNLMFELLRFYSNNKSNGQLIFTTHTTNLLNQQELVRPDEVWLTEKSEGNTRMYSLNDFKLHNTLNIENGYLDGRYGGVPVIEEISAEV
jgi:AAA15 family ATPase/GTPase